MSTIGPMDTKLSLLQEEFVTSVDSTHLNLILLPTEQCNFRCTYCYEDFSIGTMSADTIQGVKRLIDRRLNTLNSLVISWFGGEPLLARSVVEDISAHIISASKNHGNIEYIGDMTTNGYLLDTSTIEHLADLGIRGFQISLDGPEAFHDRTRVRIGGKGSFRKIWNNLLAIRRGTLNVYILLRLHLTTENLHYMHDFLLDIRETFLNDKRFSVLLKPVERLGGANDHAFEVIPMEERPRIFEEFQTLILDGVQSSPLFRSPDICYAARPNSLMIRADGRIGKCTVALADPMNNIGRLLPDGSVQIDNARLRPWLRGWKSEESLALGCPYADLLRDGTTASPTLPIQIERVSA